MRWLPEHPCETGDDMQNRNSGSVSARSINYPFTPVKELRQTSALRPCHSFKLFPSNTPSTSPETHLHQNAPPGRDTPPGHRPASRSPGARPAGSSTVCAGEEFAGHAGRHGVERAAAGKGDHQGDLRSMPPPARCRNPPARERGRRLQPRNRFPHLRARGWRPDEGDVAAAPRCASAARSRPSPTTTSFSCGRWAKACHRQVDALVRDQPARRSSSSRPRRAAAGSGVK
jgi:hypothetical protein